MYEELKGNQHKIDANKNGKVDAHDFKLLRKDKDADDIPFEGPYRQAGVRKDKYGNVIKNVARHLARKGMKANEEIELDESKAHYMSGFNSEKNGKQRKHNPFKEGSSAAYHWAKGWEHSNDGKQPQKFVNEETEEVDESYQELMALKNNIARNQKKMNSIPGIHPEKKRLAIQIEKDTKRHKALFDKQWGKNEEVEELDENAKIVAHLQKRYGDNIRKSHVVSAANDFGVDASKLAKAVRIKLGKNMLDEEHGEKHHVVIFNYGRGIQSLWPSTKAPKTYTYKEAQDIVARNKSSPFTQMQDVHSKPLSQAHTYVSGSAADKIDALQQKHGVNIKEETEQVDEDKVRVGTLAQRTQAYRDDKAKKASAKLQTDPDTGTPDYFTAAMRRKRGLPEEAEGLREISAKTVDSYREKAYAQQPAGDDGSQLYKKRKAGRDMAFKKVTHGAKVMAKEEADDDGWYTHSQMYGRVQSEKHPKAISSAEWKSGIRWHHGKNKRINIKEESKQVDEADYSAKAARAGKDIGKPGKQFSKIAAKAAAKYGSAERGRKVAGAVLANLRKEDRLVELLTNLSESTRNIMLETFTKLNEDNQYKFIAACETEDGIDHMLNFSIMNRGK